MTSESDQRIRAALAALEAESALATFPDAAAIWRRGRFLSGHRTRDVHRLPVAEMLVGSGVLVRLASASSLGWFAWGLALTTVLAAAVALLIGLRVLHATR
jgi:hypothetical protein